MIALADPCACPECHALDRAHPHEGRQLRLIASSGGPPEETALTPSDAPAVPAADVSAPQGRPVETRARGRKAGDQHAMNVQTAIAKPRRGKLNLASGKPAPAPAPAAVATPAKPRLVPSSPRLFQLRQLRRAPENVRHVRVDEDVKQLAADITAHGLLQSLIGYERDDVVYIVGGGRRYQALRHLWDEAVIDDGDFPVPVLIRDVEDAIELSLAENLQQRTMSPVDEFLAFKALMDKGTNSPAGLAKRFGFSERIVKQRLRLAELAPEILDALGSRDITIDAAMAYASSQDQALQSEVYKSQKRRGHEPHQPRNIRHDLTAKGMRTTDAIFRFVTPEIYERDGGGYEDDLFTEEVKADARTAACSTNRSWRRPPRTGWSTSRRSR